DGGALNATTIANSLDIIVTTGTVTSNGAALNNNAGASLAINGGALTGLGAIDNTSAEADAITLAAGTNLGFTTLTSSAGMISVGSGASLTGTSVALTGAADLDLNGGTITGTLDNQSTVQISLEGNVNGAFTQQGAGVETLVDGTGVIFGDTATISTGLLNADANVDVTNALTLAAGTSLDVADNVTVNGGTVSIGALAAATLGNGVTISSDTGLLDNAATLSFGTNGTLSSATTLTNSGTITFADGGALNATTIANSLDIIVTTGTVTSNGAALNNNAGASLAINGGALTGLGAIDNTSAEADAITLAAGTNLGFTTLTSSAGMISVGSGASLTGTSVALTGAADLDLNGGTITGTLDNQSTVQISLEGNVNGAFTQQGAGVETLVDGTGVIFGDTATISTGLLNADANVDVTNALTLAAGTSLDV
ncbi:beta strand repeat-containing protein, partial [Sagittula sp. S175]|uniref:beta strand repeat-containing protein n=1 Tax=Sagittula sp. S175 TaxID=3415129 RepID=UPI003C7AAC46